MKTFRTLTALLFGFIQLTPGASRAVVDESLKESHLVVGSHQPIGASERVLHVLFKRVDRPLTYADAISKGCARINAMNSGNVATSPFQDNQEIDPNTGNLVDVLEDNGWIMKRDNSKTFASSSLNDLVPAYNALGFSTSASDNPYIQVLQSAAGNTKVAYGSNYPVGTSYGGSYGNYQNVYNLKNGVVIAVDNFAPNDMDPDTVAPPLERLSDVQWLLWKSEADRKGVTSTNLNWYFRHHIGNEVTTEIIDTLLAMQNVSTELARNWHYSPVKDMLTREQPPLDAQTVGTWPGQSIAMNTDEGKAILGTVHGSGAFFFTGQHFPTRTIQSVNVFTVKNPDGSLVSANVGSSSNARVVYNLAFKIVPKATR